MSARTRIAQLFCALLLAIVAVGVMAGPASAETTIEVTTPADGRYQPGSPTALIVTIEADRAISGTISVSFEGFRAGSQQVEVPGGSAKDIVMIVSTPPWTSSGSVSFDADDDEDDKTERLSLVSASGDELVALLPELATRDFPDSAELSIDLGVARLFALDPALLDSGSEVLSTFTQVIATANDIQTLEPAHQEALEAWIGADGGILIIDEESGTSLPLDLDTRSVQLTDDVLAFGVGQIHYSDGQAISGAYDGLLQPTPSKSPDEFPWGGGFGGFPTTNLLAADAGVRVPAIGAIIGLLAIYALVAGPLLWFALKRSHREPLLWVALPAVALVATLGVWATGRAIRDSANSAHATLIADMPTLRMVSTQVLVTSANGGTAGVTMPAGWRQTSSISDDSFFFEEGPFGGSGGQIGSTPVIVGDELLTDLPPGGIGVLHAESSSSNLDPSWAFDLEPGENDGLTGTLTNLTNHELEEVFISSGQGFHRVAKMAAGESAEFTLRDINKPPLDGDRFMDQLFRNDPWSTNDGPMNAGLLTNWLSGQQALRAPGMIFAVGWTRDEVGPLVTTRGASVEAGRTAFLTAERVDPELLNDDGRVEFLRGWNSTRVSDPVPVNACADFPLTMRIGPSADSDTDELVLDVSRRAIAAFDVWDGEEWRPAGMAEATEDVLVALPRDAFDDGSLYVRVQMSCDFWGMSDPFPKLKAIASDDNVLALGALAGDGEPPEEVEAVPERDASPPGPTSDPPPPTSEPPLPTTTVGGGGDA